MIDSVCVGGGGGGRGTNKAQQEMVPRSKHACHDFNGKNEGEQGKNKLASRKFELFCLSAVVYPCG